MPDVSGELEKSGVSSAAEAAENWLSDLARRFFPAAHLPVPPERGVRRSLGPQNANCAVQETSPSPSRFERSSKQAAS